jgi:alpha-L-fucosidase
MGQGCAARRTHGAPFLNGRIMKVMINGLINRLLLSLVVATAPVTDEPQVKISAEALPMATGKFEPTWDSLKQYQCPDWFRDAKFGIWSVWGPQAVPEQGDWYARKMYQEGSPMNKYHVANYGPPSKFGYKDILPLWTAEKWDPTRLMSLYKQAGAKYFVVMVNHHDNFDLWDSKYQPWNSVAMGPKRNILGEWADAAKADGLRLGVSIHAAHTWTWFELSQGADKSGPYAGVPYDGKLTKADGKGLWWDGLDPQDLYAQNHAPSKTSNVNAMWDWNNGASIPDQAYCDKFYNRTLDVINRYQPDLLYFDDTVLPLYPVSDAGLKIAAHFYNNSMAQHGGKLEAVLNGKILSEDQRKTMVWDIERGQTNEIEPEPWQTDTCVGDWFYKQGVKYKSSGQIIHMLADIVSKNGNLLLNAPLAPDGTLDEAAEKTLIEIGRWLDINGEAIYGTRPWKVFGEGPAMEKATAMTRQGFNEGDNYSAQDIRFTTKGGTLYAIALGQPTGELKIKSFGTAAHLLDQPIGSVTVLGSADKVGWSQDADALTIKAGEIKLSGSAVVFKITP